MFFVLKTRHQKRKDINIVSRGSHRFQWFRMGSKNCLWNFELLEHAFAHIIANNGNHYKTFNHSYDEPHVIKISIYWFNCCSLNSTVFKEMSSKSNRTRSLSHTLCRINKTKLPAKVQFYGASIWCIAWTRIKFPYSHQNCNWTWVFK